MPGEAHGFRRRGDRLLFAAAVLAALECADAVVRPRVLQTTSRLQSGLGTLDIWTGVELAAAIADPGVRTINLRRDLSLRDSDFGDPALGPVERHTDLTIVGATGRATVLDLGFVREKVLLRGDVTVAVRNAMVVNFRGGSVLAQPGCDMFTSLPGELPRLRLDQGYLVYRVCYPLTLAIQAGTLVSRPAEVPGTNSYTVPLPQPARCENSTSVHLLDRCYAYTYAFNDVAVYASDQAASGLRAPNKYIMEFVRSVAMCPSLLNQECIDRLGPVGCALYTVAAMQPPPPGTAQASSPPAGGRGTPASPPVGNGTVILIGANPKTSSKSKDEGPVSVGVLVGGIIGGLAGAGLLLFGALVLARRRWEAAEDEALEAMALEMGLVLDPDPPPPPPMSYAASEDSRPSQRHASSVRRSPAERGHSTRGYTRGTSSSGRVYAVDAPPSMGGGLAPPKVKPGTKLRVHVAFARPSAPSPTGSPQRQQSGMVLPCDPLAPDVMQPLHVQACMDQVHVHNPAHAHPMHAHGYAQLQTQPQPQPPAPLLASSRASPQRPSGRTSTRTSAPRHDGAGPSDRYSPGAGPEPRAQSQSWRYVGPGAGHEEGAAHCGDCSGAVGAGEDSSAALTTEASSSRALLPHGKSSPVPASLRSSAAAAGARLTTSGAAGAPLGLCPEDHPAPEPEAAAASGSGAGGGGREAGSNTVTLTSRVLGTGAFGAVMEGRYRGMRVAVKLLPEADVMVREGEAAALETPLQPVARALAQEVSVLGRCHHPCIVRLLAACLGPRPCLVMELCETNLERLVFGEAGRSGQLLPLQTVLHIAVQIASALAYLHPTVVHRDLKPANILINGADTPFPVAKLADFGLSRLRSTAVPTLTPEAGTPIYTAPECFDVTTTVVTHHADMYSLAVLLWVLLTGQRPWEGEPAVRVAYRVTILGQRLSLDYISPGRCPPRLRALLAQCWEADPLRRPAAAEALKELEAVAAQTSSPGSQLDGEAGAGDPGASGSAGWSAPTLVGQRQSPVWAGGAVPWAAEHTHAPSTAPVIPLSPHPHAHTHQLAYAHASEAVRVQMHADAQARHRQPWLQTPSVLIDVGPGDADLELEDEEEPGPYRVNATDGESDEESR